MESVGDKLRALLYAVLVHLACIAVMFVGLLWTRSMRPVSVSGAVIEAELVGPTQAQKPRASTRKAPPKPVEPPTPSAEEQKREADAAELKRQELQERERVSALAQQKAEQAKREQEERKHQEQVELQEKQQAEQERQDRELQRKLEKARAEREKAEKSRKLEQEKLAQLQDRQKADQKKLEHEVLAADTRQTGTNGQDNSLLARYISSIQTAVTQNWNRPDSAQVGLKCAIHVVQIPGGEVIAAHVAAPCNADPITRASIEQAVMKAQPLPYQGYEKVFARDITFNFTYDG